MTLKDLQQKTESLLNKYEEELPVLMEEIHKYFLDNPHSLYGNEAYPETILELDIDKVKSFTLETQTEAFNLGYKEGLEKARELMKEKVKTQKDISENADLSFLNYTPTEIYNKAITDILESLEEELKK